ncbi:iron ABC transporter permease [Ureaplasma miroungigenitalium]|uniref:Iron ABC transporter permease n=1 Tax=Ureaplasma miroungigenitalium TaxID=1042321 RepID=A0ABT3BMC8_9BACT|nr:iron ABC transporter permease [Ureaplasma miroungigenitalium]MCV3728241.1 iron ABC transporter permease [Ureaplasma miroungigenitalium]
MHNEDIQQNNKNKKPLKQRFFALVKKIDHKQTALIKMISLAVILGVIIFLVLFLYHDNHQTNFFINAHLYEIRSKKAIMAVFSGGALAVAGLLLQKATRNNLADISLLGIGSLNIIIMSFYLLSVKSKIQSNGWEMQILPLIAFLASIVGSTIIYVLSRFGGLSSEKFIIVGIALSFLFEAISVVLANPNANGSNVNSLSNMFKEAGTLDTTIKVIQKYTYGIIPNSNYIQWNIIIPSAVMILITLIPIWFLRRKIDLYETSEDLARTAGVNVERLRLIIYLLVAILAGTEAVMVGFVALLGVLGSNVAKQMFGNKTTYTMFGAFLIGSILVTSALFISSNLNTNVPVGFLSTTIVVPYFIYLIIRGK